MTDLTDRRPTRRTGLRNAVTGALIATGVVVAASLNGFDDLARYLASFEFQPRAPDWALLDRQSLALKIHLGSALIALAIGTILMAGVKGDRLHRALGWTWVLTMGVTAVSSLFLRQLNHDAFSLIHLLSGWTIVTLPMVVYWARRHKVAAHKRTVMGLFYGGLLLAGLFALMPGRVLWAVFVA